MVGPEQRIHLRLPPINPTQRKRPRPGVIECGIGGGEGVPHVGTDIQ